MVYMHKSNSLNDTREHAARRRISLEQIALIGLAIIVAFDIFYCVRFVVGPSFYGDDATYVSLAASVVYPSQPGMPMFIEGPYIFSVRLLQIMPIAFFYALFGVSLLSDAAWDITAFIGTVIVAYFLGRKLHSKTAGIISALLLSVFPLVAILAPTISDDITMMFVASLAMLALLYAERGHSRWWYFAAGMLLVASPLVTPEGFIIIIVAFLYILIELMRKKIKVDRTSLYLIYGLVAAGVLLMAYNYINCGNPLVTLTTNSNFYSKVGPKGYIPSTNTDPCFYIDTMFPYNLLLSPAPIPPGGSNYATCVKYVNYGVLVNLILGRMSISSLLSIISNNYNQTGFFFYFFVIAAIYLVVRRVRGSFFVLFWFFAAFLYLEFGPMHVSFNPFVYLMSYRLERFLTIIAVPTVLAIGMALAEPLHNLRSKKKHMRAYIWFAVVILAVIFLVATSIPLNIYWYNSQTYSKYDQLAIANYLSKLPSYTKIYYASGFSFIPIYMDYINMSRFYAYDEISNCHNIPNGSYVVIPKYQQFIGLNYTPHPREYCPEWQLVLYPNITAATGINYSSGIVSMGIPFAAKLYYVPGKIISSPSTQPTQPQQNQSGAKQNPTSAYAPSYELPYSEYNYYNLTGVGVVKNGKLQSFAVVNNVSYVNVSLNKSTASPGEIVSLDVIFIGNFSWDSGTNATKYYLNSPLINFHYYGVELANQSGKLYDQNNGPWYFYVQQFGEPHQLLYKNGNRFMLVHWNISPTANVTGKTIKICGGYFATYENTTLHGGFGNLFNYLSMNQTNVVNSSVINLQSKNCAYLKVV